MRFICLWIYDSSTSNLLNDVRIPMLACPPQTPRLDHSQQTHYLPHPRFLKWILLAYFCLARYLRIGSFPLLVAWIRHKPVLLWKKTACLERIALQAGFLQGAQSCVWNWSPTDIYLDALAKCREKWKKTLWVHCQGKQRQIHNLYMALRLRWDLGAKHTKKWSLGS